MKFLYKYNSKLVGNNNIFIYWDKKAQALEFNFLGCVKSFWIKPK